MAGSARKKKLGASWVQEVESEIESLRYMHADMRRRLSELDIEGEALWEMQVRRWRRLEKKLQKLAERAGEGVHPGLAANIENLMARLEETYEELDGLLD
jgi:SMC interacting uncharacterized protein involved in chromosome segregation